MYENYDVFGIDRIKVKKINYDEVSTESINKTDFLWM